jgi:hypothetical protein
VVADLVVDRDQRRVAHDLVEDGRLELVLGVHDALEGAVVIDPEHVQVALEVAVDALGGGLTELLEIRDSLFQARSLQGLDQGVISPMRADVPRGSRILLVSVTLVNEQRSCVA